jgi:hypothetical protein
VGGERCPRQPENSDVDFTRAGLDFEQLTKDVLIGSIEQEPTANNILIYNFAITAPAINNHKFAILTLQYSITIYPLTLTDHTTHVQRQCLK